MTTMTSGQLDVLNEIVNKGIKKAADIMNEMLESHIELQVPCLVTSKYADVKDGSVCSALSKSKLVSVELGFHGSFSGKCLLAFPEEGAAKLTAVLIGEEPDSVDLNEVIAETLTELGNIVINGVMGSISNCLANLIDYSLPCFKKGELSMLLKDNDLSDNSTLILAETAFEVQDIHLRGAIFIVFELDSLGKVFSEIDKYIKNNFEENRKGCSVN